MNYRVVFLVLGINTRFIPKENIQNKYINYTHNITTIY